MNCDFGWIRDPDAVNAVLAALPNGVFAEAAPQLLGDEGDAFLWEGCKKITGNHLVAHNQLDVGCCVGEGFSSAVEYLSCVEIALGTSAEFVPVCSEAVYALSRVEIGGGRLRGDGSVGAWAAKAVSQFGVLPRQSLGSYDLSHFDPKRARNWGASGLPDDLEPTARQYPVRTASLVKSFPEARAAIAHGYPVAVCSDQGFSMTRDHDGFCSPRGTWNHCMCFIGAVGGHRPGLCCLQSWGPETPGGPIGIGEHPACAFWVDAEVADRMLRQGDSWALSAFVGFPARTLDWRI
jgi:hypothetical protein